MKLFFTRHRALLLTGFILLLLWSLFAVISPMTFLHARIYTSLLSAIPLTVLLALGGGMLCELLNALLVVRLNVPPIIATIGTQFFLGAWRRCATTGFRLCWWVGWATG